RKPTGFRFAAGDPENIRKAGERLGGGIGIGRLGIVDEEHTPLAADLLHPVREARKRAEALMDDGWRDTERERRAARAGSVLRIMRPAQRADLAEAGDRARRAPGRAHDLLGLDIESVRERAAH